VVVITWILWKRRMGGSSKGDGQGGFDFDPERGAHTPEEKAKMDFESEHDVAFDFGAFFRERARRSQGSSNGGAAAAAAKEEGLQVGELEDRLPVAAEALPRGQQLQRPKSVVVAELDGGGVPEYRGVVGVGR
jgi:hypothetical protein